MSTRARAFVRYQLRERGLLLGPERLRAGEVLGLGGPANTFDFEGFFPPVEAEPALNVVQAGSSVPLKFSLGGDKGLGVIAAGYPASASLDCATLSPSDTFEPAKPAGGGGLTYDAASGQYTWVWKTDKSWQGCGCWRSG